MTGRPDWPRRSIAETYALLTQPGAPFEMQEEVVGGVSMRAYARAPRSLRTIFDGALRWQDREHVVYQDERLSFGAVHRAASHLGVALAARYGVGKGDRVALAMRNYPEWIVAFWAVAASGAVIVPVNAWGGGEELCGAVADSGAKVLIADAERVARFAAAGGAAPVIAVRAAPDALHGATPLQSLIGPLAAYASLASVALPDPGLAPDDDATIFYTSGTTGRPKGVLGTHRNIATNVVNLGLRTARAALRRGEAWSAAQAPGQRVTLAPCPFFHVTGTHSGIVPAMHAGTKLVLMYKWDADEALTLAERERVNAIVTVPTMSWGLVEAAARTPRTLPALDTVTYGGAPASPDLPGKLAEAFPGAFVAYTYGMTEASSAVISNSAEDLQQRPDSVGTIMPCNDYRLVDEHGRDVAPGQAGELLVRGPNVVKGYWNRPEKSAEILQDGWLRTGDILRVDEEGFFYVLDRSKDMLIRGGENVYCGEVEAVLVCFPGVLDAAVVGAPHPVLGEEVAAFLQTAPGGVDEDALRTFVSGRLAAFKAPAWIFQQSDPLPRSETGKVMKRELRARLTKG